MEYIFLVNVLKYDSEDWLGWTDFWMMRQSSTASYTCSTLKCLQKTCYYLFTRIPIVGINAIRKFPSNFNWFRHFPKRCSYFFFFCSWFPHGPVRSHRLLLASGCLSVAQNSNAWTLYKFLNTFLIQACFVVWGTAMRRNIVFKFGGSTLENYLDGIWEDQIYGDW